MLVVLAAPGAAAADDLLSERLSVPDAVDRTCTERPLSGAGTDQRSVSAPATGWVTARLEGDGPGDWDLAVFDADSGRPVAGSASFGTKEVAQGFATQGQHLIVQACRRSGGAGANLAVSSTAVDTKAVEPPQLVNVSTPNAARKSELQSLGLDVTEAGGAKSLVVVLHGAKDAQKLRDHKFTYTVVVKDLAARDARDRAADQRFSRDVSASDFPSGRTTYRHLADYQNDLKQLSEDNPDLVKPVVLPFATWTGREVAGIEITEDAEDNDGKPVFLLMGVHHAREWPSSENTMEFAFDLIKRYRDGDERTRRLLANTRTIVVPIVNPDGFNTSREAPSSMDDGREGDENVSFQTLPFEYQRKNCRMLDDSPAGDCTQAPNLGFAQFGVDPNRNYGGFWGGPGASTDQTAQDYRGPGPFSEPETRNIRDLVSHRQVVTLITNHTFSDLLLRPPGIAIQGPPPDETIYKALGDSMAEENGYSSQRSYQLYDTTGATEDWTYYSTGGLGFTFEMGCTAETPDGGCSDGWFHPSYAKTIAEYEGTTDRSDPPGHDGHGNREAYYKALESTADASKHAVVEGSAPAGATLRLHKEFDTKTSPVLDEAGEAGPVQQFHDTLDTTMQVPASGQFRWDINQSTRPVVAVDKGRVPTGPVSDPIAFSGAAGPEAAACEDFDTSDPNCFNEHPFTVPADADRDNDKAEITVTWASSESDWDVKVWKDTNGDGSSINEQADGEQPVAISGGSSNVEKTTIANLQRGDKYVIRMQNYLATDPYDGTVEFKGPDPFVPAQVESWKLTCESSGGAVGASQDLTIARGERKGVDLSGCSSVVGGAGGTGGAGNGSSGTPSESGAIPGAGVIGAATTKCVAGSARVAGRGVGAARLGRTRTAQRQALGGTPNGGHGQDRWCVEGGGALRVGYATGSLAKAGAARRSLRGRTVLILTTSKNARGAGAAKPGKRAKKPRGATSVRKGRETWYFVKGRRVTNVVRTRARKVVEVGVAEPRLARGSAARKLVKLG